jgi:hypothetical protein
MATTINAGAPTFVVMPGDLVLFLDTRLPVSAGNETNQVAVVVDEQGALYIGKGVIGRRIRRIPLQELPSLPKVQLRRTKHAGYGDLIARYFLKHANQPSYFEAGLRALHCDNHQPFETGRLFPERPTYRSDDEYEAAWARFKSLLKPLDGIYTVDQSSRISRFIAWATHGTWSHVALYIGDGEIHESVTSGVREVPLEIYKGRQYWVAAYRHIGAITNPRSVQEARASARSLPFRRDRYNYPGAIKFGLRAFFNDHSPDLVPNSAMYAGNRIFIAQV